MADWKGRRKRAAVRRRRRQVSGCEKGRQRTGSAVVRRGDGGGGKVTGGAERRGCRQGRRRRGRLRRRAAESGDVTPDWKGRRKRAAAVGRVGRVGCTVPGRGWRVGSGKIQRQGSGDMGFLSNRGNNSCAFAFACGSKPVSSSGINEEGASGIHEALPTGMRVIRGDRG